MCVCLGRVCIGRPSSTDDPYNFSDFPCLTLKS
uniref:Uncharacterized protein n=1 Tax=Anguilla anguilla TaxID=7936 RepID=A0A0E9PVA1_ANGAN